MLLRKFRINRLYGYKNIEIDFAGNVRILIAGNGSGKTTIFNALYAVLSGKLHRLNSMKFESIECEFDNFPLIRIDRADIKEVPTDVLKGINNFVSRMQDLDSEDVVAFLQSEYELGGIREQVSKSQLLRTIYSSMPGGYDEVGAELDNYAAHLRSVNSSVLIDTVASIKSIMSGVEVLYLPTYRRIELPLLKPSKKAALSRMPLPSADPIFTDGTADTRHINFGLADVEKRLSDLSESVERESNFEYRNISATILDEALADRIEVATSTDMTDLPEIESLRRFLSRVSQGADHFGFLYPPARRSAGGVKNEQRISAIANLYNSGEILAERQRFLRYFLTRLGTVIEKTQATEAMLQRFVDACNEYLAESTDEKIFTYDPNAMRVKVINSWTGDDISLANLSSGEKQIVSILARLYLYENEKFVLIDEPELSLSIDWQKRILPDMFNSGSVVQLFAITHSPFIFDNELDPFAGPLKAKKVRVERGADSAD